MALIAANRLTVTIPNGPDDPPAEDVARRRITRWLEGEYGYVPPLERLEGHGWSACWEVGGRTTTGWRYEAVIPRHLGPARDEVARARHPAGASRRSGPGPAATPPADRPGRSASRPRSSGSAVRSRRPSPEVADALARIDTLFAALPGGGSGADPLAGT